MNGDELVDIGIGLESNNLMDYDYMLTGYIGNSFIHHNLLL